MGGGGSKFVACSKCKLPFEIEKSVGDSVVCCPKCAEDNRNSRYITLQCKFCNGLHRVAFYDEGDLEQLLRQNSEVNIYCLKCSDGFRNLVLQGKYLQLRVKSANGEEFQIVYPKQLNDLVQERIKGGNLKIITG